MQRVPAVLAAVVVTRVVVAVGMSMAPEEEGIHVVDSISRKIGALGRGRSLSHGDIAGHLGEGGGE